MAKILVVSNVCVPPVIAGSCKCISSYCALLSDLGHEVYFLYSGLADEQKVRICNEYWKGRFLHFNYLSFAS